MSAPPSIAVVVCAYTEQRWEDLLAAYRSLGTQSTSPDEIVVVIDHNESLLDRLRLQFPYAHVVPNSGPRGLSGARNTGIESTTSEIVLFLDDDATAGPDWVRDITAPFSSPDVQGVAGWATPNWDEPGRPTWFPEPFLWVVGCSYEGLPVQQTDIRNPLGCAMGFRRDALELVGGFSDTVGRIGAHPVGCEETEFSIRLRQTDPTARIVMVPEAVVHHRVSDARLTRTYFLQRCYWEGVSKAVVSAGVGSQDALETERSYTTRVLPKVFGRGLMEAARGDFAGIQRSAAVASGLVITSAGFLRGKLAGRRDTTPLQPSNRSLQRVVASSSPDGDRARRQGAA